MINSQPLLHLLNAPNAQLVDDILITCFQFRHDGLSDKKKATWAQTLQIKESEVDELSKSVSELIHESVYIGATAPDQVATLLPSDFHGNLRGLLCKKIALKVPAWRSAALNNQVSPPKLIDLDWRVDSKASSSSLSRMAVPTVLLEMKIQETPTEVGVMAGVKTVQLELSKQELATMLEGLGKIRDQLGGIAK